MHPDVIMKIIPSMMSFKSTIAVLCQPLTLKEVAIFHHILHIKCLLVTLHILFSYTPCVCHFAAFLQVK